MAQLSEWLTKDEKALCEEIVRVSTALKKKTLALTGDQFRMYERMQKRLEYKDQFSKKIDKIELYSTEAGKRARKADTLDFLST